jgi:transposase
MKGALLKELVELLDEGLAYIRHELSGDQFRIFTRSNRDEAMCPYCGTASSRIHSTYGKSFQDLPIQGKKVYISIANRKFFCDNTECAHKTFAESFQCVRHKAKKSRRLLDEILKVSVEVSSVNASRMLKDGVVDISKSTICDILKKNGRSAGQGKNRENMH